MASDLRLGSVSALLPPLEGVSERSERGCGISVCNSGCQRDRPEFYVDGLIYYLVLSGSSVEPDNTNGSKSNHQHKEASGVRLKCAT